MKIEDLTQENEELFCLCLEDWSDEAKEAGPKRGEWVARMKGRGLGAKLAKDDEGNVGGMIQYVPIEESHVEGSDLYLILCVWVHGYKDGRGNFQKRGMGKALLAAAEEDARQRGAKGMAAWGISLPIWMSAKWFKKQGYVKADKNSVAVLMWKPFSEDAEPPRWIKERKHPSRTPERVTVTMFTNGWCMGQNLVYERAKRVAAEHGDKVVFEEIDTSQREVLEEWGLVDALYIDGKAVRTGPPPSVKKLRKRVGKAVRRLKT